MEDFSNMNHRGTWRVRLGDREIEARIQRGECSISDDGVLRTLPETEAIVALVSVLAGQEGASVELEAEGDERVEVVGAIPSADNAGFMLVPDDSIRNAVESE